MSESTAIFSDADMVERMAAQREAEAPNEEEVENEDLEAEGAEPAPEPDEDPAPADGDHEEEAEEAGEESHALEAPDTWPTDRLEDWNSLPVEAQEVLIAREEEVQRFKSKTGREAAEAKRQAEEAANRIETEYKDRIEKLNEMLPQLAENFKSKWETIDWVKLAEENPDEYTRMKAQAEVEKGQLEKAAVEAQQANAKAAAESQAKQHQALLDRNPQYVGEAGQKLLMKEAKEVEEFALGLEGVTRDQLQQITAPLYETLRDAMKYRQAAKTATKPAKKPAQKTARPGARKSNTEVSKKIQSDAKGKLKALAKSGAGRSQQDRAFAEALAAKRRTG